MSALPVIIREMRAQARQPLTHWLRMVGGISVVGAIAAALWSVGGMGFFAGSSQDSSVVVGWSSYSPFFAGPLRNQFQSFGTTLFSKMNLFIFTSIWLFVP